MLNSLCYNFGNHVHSGLGFVQEQDLGLPQERSSQVDQLPLANAKIINSD